MKIRVYRERVTLPLGAKKGEPKSKFFVAERKENDKLVAFSLMTERKGK